MTRTTLPLAVLVAALSLAPTLWAQDATAPGPDATPPRQVTPPPVAEPPAAQPVPPSAAPGAAGMERGATGSVPPDRRRRFEFSRTGDSLLRLDSETGQVALCSPRSVGWSCQAVPEERAALETEIARLQSEIEGLKTEIAALKPAEAVVPRPPADVPPAKESELKLPNRENLEQARAFIENAWHRLVDMIAALQKDIMRKS